VTKALFILLFLAWGFFFTGIGDYYAKKAALTGAVSKWLWMWFYYNVAMFGWFFMIRHIPQLGRMSLVWSLASTGAGIVVGLLIFHERWQGFHIVGGLLAITSIVLLSRG
jgi:hypothetical protein